LIRFLKKLFGVRKPESQIVPEEKPHPAQPESLKRQANDAPRNDSHNKSRDNQQGNQQEGESSNRRRNRNRNRNRNKNHQKNENQASSGNDSGEKAEPRRERHPHSRKVVELVASNPDDSWVPPEPLPEAKEGEISFYSLNLSNPILHGIADLGFSQCTDIQSSVLPEALKMRDIAGKAQTGTGKTAAFLISVFDYFLKNPLTELTAGSPRCLIIAPTRELAVQIGKDARELGKYCDANVVTVFGGMDYEKQAAEFAGRVDIVVATPGRLLDYSRKRIVHLNKAEMLVIDEADRMLDMGFIPDVRRIISQLPSSDKRVTQLFSATLSDSVMNLARRWMKEDYHIVEIDPDTVVSENVEQLVYMVTANQKVPIISYYLNNDEVQRMMIFTNRKDESMRLADSLYAHGVDLELLTGDVPQKKRMSILERFRKGEVKVVVATDVAGRGIHVDNVSHVINFELPYEAEDYVHRVGRTGRAGEKGRAISFACENSAFELPSIEEYIGSSLKCSQPEEEMLVEPPVVRQAPVRKPSPNRNRRNSGGSGGGYKGNRSGGGYKGNRGGGGGYKGKR